MSKRSLETAIDRHNTRVASRLQRAVQVTLWCYVIGPVAYPLLRLLLRVRVVGGERVARPSRPAVFAVQHRYEWDAFVGWLAVGWPRSLLRWRVVPMVFVGRAWLATRTRRAVAWCCGQAGLQRGQGVSQSGFARARLIASRRRRPSFVIFPTGPTGRHGPDEIRPGVCHLVSSVPGCSLFPVALLGLRELRLRDVAALRRPRLTVVLGEPVDPSGLSDAGVHAHVRTAWERAEREHRTVERRPRRPAPPVHDPRRGADGAAVPRRAWLVLCLSALGFFMLGLDTTVVNIAFPAIEADLPGASRHMLSWMLDGFSIMLAAFVVPAGRYANVIGVRRVFLTGFALFTLASIGCGAAADADQLVAARFAQGLGAALFAPAAMALALREFPPNRRALAVSVLGAAVGVSGALGPVLGGLLVEAAGWRSIFLINAPVGVLAVIAGTRLLREVRDPSSRRPDLVGAALLAAGLALAATAIMRGEEWGWTSQRLATTAIASIVLVAGCVVRSRRHPAPAIELSLFRLPLVAAGNGATALFFVGFLGLLPVQILYLATVWGHSAIEAGLATAPFPAIGAVVAVAAGRYVDIHGFRAPAVLGPLVFACGAAFLAFVPGPEPAFASDWLPGMVLLGIGSGLSFPAQAAAALSSLQPSQHASGSGLNMAARHFGAVFGFTLAVVLVGTPAPGEVDAAFERAFLLGAVAGLLSAAIGLRLRRARAGEPAGAPPAHERLADALAALGPEAAARSLLASLPELRRATPDEVAGQLLRSHDGNGGGVRQRAVSRSQLAGSEAADFLRACGVRAEDVAGILRRAGDSPGPSAAVVLSVSPGGWRPAVEVLAGATAGAARNGPAPGRD